MRQNTVYNKYHTIIWLWTGNEYIRGTAQVDRFADKVREMIWTCTEIMIHWTKGAKYGVSGRRGGGSWMK